MWVKRICQTCGKEFIALDSPTRKGRGKNCSMPCYRKSRKGGPAWNKGKPAPWAIGNTFRLGKSNPNPHKMFADVNHKWKGGKVGYRALHYWVERKLGKPKKCEFCLVEKAKFHWANKSGDYLRNVSDWIRLCVKCHRKYDFKG